MNIRISKNFEKSFKKLDRKIQKKILAVIREVELSEYLKDIQSVKPMQGYQNYFRIREGDYRVGIFLEEDNTVSFLDVGARGDFYKKFP